MALVSIKKKKEDNQNLLLPVIEVSDLSENQRAQIDQTLDGKVHILTAGPGIASVSISLLDNLPECTSTELQSVIAAYKDTFRTKPEVSVSILRGKDSVMTLDGVVMAFSANVTSREGLSLIVVTLKIVGQIS
jgi:hypothetical protein